MKLLENYALQLGQKIDKIHTLEKYFPLSIDNFIVFSPFSKPSKNFDYWIEVLSTIYPILEKSNIKILQIGAKGEPNLPYCINLQGQTNWGQVQYLISKSKLVLSSDSAASHLTGHYNKPLVVLISNNLKECVSPFFGDKNKQIILEPDRSNKNPSFQLDEGPNKQINEIKPEQIIESVLKLLNIEYKSEYKTLEIGNCYSQRIVECVPDQVVSLDNLGVPNLVVRMDYLFDEPNLFNQLRNCKCVVITDRPINPELLNSVRPNIVEVFYHIKESPTPDPNFYKTLFNLKIPFKMFSFMSEEKINPLKLDALDFGIIHKKSGILPKNLDTNNLSKYYVKSNKFLLSNKLVYQNYYFYKNNLPIPKIEPTPQQLVNENLELLSIDGEYNYFLEKI